MNYFVKILILLIAFSFSKLWASTETEIIKELLARKVRPSIQEYINAFGGTLPNENPVSEVNGFKVNTKQENIKSQAKDVAELIVAVNFHFPNHVFIPIGRDSYRVSDFMEAFAILRGSPEDVVRVHGSGPTIKNDYHGKGGANKVLSDYMIQEGWNPDPSNGKVAVLFDNTGGGSSSQLIILGRAMISRVKSLFPGTPDDVLNSIFAGVSTASGVSFGSSESDVKSIKRTQKQFVKNFKNDSLGGGYLIKAYGMVRSLMYNESIIGWNESFSPFKFEGEKVVPSPGRAFSKSSRLYTLWRFHEILKHMSSEEFQMRLAASAQNWGMKLEQLYSANKNTFKKSTVNSRKEIMNLHFKSLEESDYARSRFLSIHELIGFFRRTQNTTEKEEQFYRDQVFKYLMRGLSSEHLQSEVKVIETIALFSSLLEPDRVDFLLSHFFSNMTEKFRNDFKREKKERYAKLAIYFRQIGIAFPTEVAVRIITQWYEQTLSQEERTDFEMFITKSRYSKNGWIKHDEFLGDWIKSQKIDELSYLNQLEEKELANIDFKMVNDLVLSKPEFEEIIKELVAVKHIYKKETAQGLSQILRLNPAPMLNAFMPDQRGPKNVFDAARWYFNAVREYQREAITGLPKYDETRSYFVRRNNSNSYFYSNMYPDMVKRYGMSGVMILDFEAPEESYEKGLYNTLSSDPAYTSILITRIKMIPSDETGTELENIVQVNNREIHAEFRYNTNVYRIGNKLSSPLLVRWAHSMNASLFTQKKKNSYLPEDFKVGEQIFITEVPKENYIKILRGNLNSRYAEKNREGKKHSEISKNGRKLYDAWVSIGVVNRKSEVSLALAKVAIELMDRNRITRADFQALLQVVMLRGDSASVHSEFLIDQLVDGNKELYDAFKILDSGRGSYEFGHSKKSLVSSVFEEAKARRKAARYCRTSTAKD